MNKTNLLKIVAGAAVVSSILLLSGCATEANYAAAVYSWRGASQSSLYTVWGYPNKVQTLPNGHKLLVYKYENKGVNPTYYTPGSTNVRTNRYGDTRVSSSSGYYSGGGSYDYNCMTQFELSRKGYVLNASFRGNNCVGTQDFALQYANPKNRPVFKNN
jgi:hypothetical protein